MRSMVLREAAPLFVTLLLSCGDDAPPEVAPATAEATLGTVLIDRAGTWWFWNGSTWSVSNNYDVLEDRRFTDVVVGAPGGVRITARGPSAVRWDGNMWGMWAVGADRKI